MSNALETRIEPELEAWMLSREVVNAAKKASQKESWEKDDKVPEFEEKNYRIESKDWKIIKEKADITRV